VLVFDPHQDPFHDGVAARPAGGDEARGWTANPIDVMFKNIIQQVTASVSTRGRPEVVNQMKKNPRWQTAFVKVSPMLGGSAASSSSASDTCWPQLKL
jgi:hypothetical protein